MPVDSNVILQGDLEGWDYMQFPTLIMLWIEQTPIAGFWYSSGVQWQWHAVFQNCEIIKSELRK